jgi:hypothetical protein
MKRYTAISLTQGLILLIVLGALIVIAIMITNPAQKLAQQRNDRRIDGVTAIANALSEYAIDNEGTLPQEIPVSNECEDETNEICRTGGADCSGLVQLNALTKEEEYLVSIPVDPQQKDLKGTGYNIVQNESGRVTICAPLAELDAEISTTK